MLPSISSFNFIYFIFFSLGRGVVTDLMVEFPDRFFSHELGWNLHLDQVSREVRPFLQRVLVLQQPFQYRVDNWFLSLHQALPKLRTVKTNFGLPVFCSEHFNTMQFWRAVWEMWWSQVPKNPWIFHQKTNDVWRRQSQFVHLKTLHSSQISRKILSVPRSFFQAREWPRWVSQSFNNFEISLNVWFGSVFKKAFSSYVFPESAGGLYFRTLRMPNTRIAVWSAASSRTSTFCWTNETGHFQEMLSSGKRRLPAMVRNGEGASPSTMTLTTTATTTRQLPKESYFCHKATKNWCTPTTAAYSFFTWHRCCFVALSFLFVVCCIVFFPLPCYFVWSGCDCRGLTFGYFLLSLPSDQFLPRRQWESGEAESRRVNRSWWGCTTCWTAPCPAQTRCTWAAHSSFSEILKWQEIKIRRLEITTFFYFIFFFQETKKHVASRYEFENGLT